MPSGDYLWRVNDHAKTRREIARHSKVDAEAYEEYGKAMVEMGRFVKPILNMTPPDPTSLDPRGLMDLAVPRPPLPGAVGPGQVQPGPADDDERGRFPRPVVRDRRAQGDDVGVGDHRHVPRRALARHRVRAAAPLHGRDRRRVPLVGTVARRHRRDLRTRSPTRRAKPASRSAPRRRSRGSSSRTAPPSASCSRTATTTPPTSWRRASTRARRFSKLVGEEHLPAEFVDDVKRYKFRGSSGKVNMALDALPDFTCLPGPGAHLRGAVSISPSVEYMERAYDEAKYGRFSRQPYIDIVIPSLTDPSVAPPGKHVMSCFVQYAPYHLKEGTLGRRSARRSATPSSTRSPSTRRTSRTSSCTGRC